MTDWLFAQTTHVVRQKFDLHVGRSSG